MPTDEIQPFSFGVHPWYLPTAADADDPAPLFAALDAQFSSVFALPNALAVGECGIDRHTAGQSDGASLAMQMRVFEWQVAFAERIRKPVVVHSVRGFEEVANVKRRFAGVPMMLHGFVNRLTIAEQMLRLPNLYLSFGAALLNPASPVRGVFAALPLHRLLLETDLQTAHPIEAIYAEAALLRGISQTELENRLAENAAAFLAR